MPLSFHSERLIIPLDTHGSSAEDQYWANCWSHDECGPEEELAAAVVAVQSRNVVALRRVMGSEAKVVVVNTERSAVQLLGCAGQVVGHLPVDEVFLRVLTR